MRILIVSQYFFPEDFRINDLALSLKERGHEVAVLTGMPNYPRGRFFDGYGPLKKWRETWNGIEVYRVPIWPRGRGGAINLSLNYLSFIFSAILFGLLRVGRNHDTIFVYGVSPILSALPAILLRSITGIPIALWVQDLWPQSVSAVGAIKNQLILKQIERAVRFIYKKSDLILIQSEGFRPNVGLLSEKEADLRYFPNWAEDLYRPIAPKDVVLPLDSLPAGFRVMFAGNIGLAQAVPVILEAAKKLRDKADIQWIFLGDGADRAKMEQAAQAAGLGDIIHFLGRFPMQTMPHFFACADAMLVTLRPDPIFAITIPSRIQSYLACGRPIIGSLDGEGQRLIVASGAGFSGPAGDPSALADNVLRLFEMSREAREDMGAQGLRYYRSNFDRQVLVQSLEAQLIKLHS